MAVCVVASLPIAPANADSSVLWNIVHNQCVPNQLQRHEPAPCARVSVDPDEAHGYAVLKDIVGARQYLLIPTARIAGIESPELAAPNSPNYFAFAWQAREFVELQAGGPLPREWLSLAVNAANARTQDQLHIHIDCLSAEAHAALVKYRAGIGSSWAPFPAALAGHTYYAMAISGEQLETVNPFQLLADAKFPDAHGSNLVVVGSRDQGGAPGFVILANRADDGTGNTFGGEELQDHNSCPAPELLSGSNSK